MVFIILLCEIYSCHICEPINTPVMQEHVWLTMCVCVCYGFNLALLLLAITYICDMDNSQLLHTCLLYLSYTNQ